MTPSLDLMVAASFACALPSWSVIRVAPHRRMLRWLRSAVFPRVAPPLASEILGRIVGAVISFRDRSRVPEPAAELHARKVATARSHQV